MPNFYENLGHGLRGIGGYLSPEFETGAGVGAGLRNRRKRSDLDITAPTSQDRKIPANPTQPMLDATVDAEADVVANLPAFFTSPPSRSESRASLPILPNRRDLPIAPGSISKSPAVEAPAPRFDMDMDRRNVPIPQLPGHAGGPRPYDPIAATKYDRVMAHAKRDAEGDLIPRSEGGGFHRPGIKDVLQNAMRGAALGYQQTGDVAGAIGGALSAGAGSAINPQAGYEFAFDVGERPRLESEMERSRRGRAQAMADVLEQLKFKEAQARIEGMEAQTEKLRRPEAPRPPIRSDRGLWDPATRSVIPGTEPLPKERQQALREGPDANYYDVNDPAQAEILRQLNAKLPRDKHGRFITRADERATVRAGGGGASSGRNDRAMQKAVDDFERTKRSLEDATSRGDKAMMNDLRRRLQNQAANLASRYGDMLEVGGGDWPYVKPRGAQGASSVSMSRAEARRRLMAEGYDDAEAESELNRLGIR